MEKVLCVNCDSSEVIEQVAAMGMFTREVNENVNGPIEVKVVSWEPVHAFYECRVCGCRW